MMARRRPIRSDSAPKNRPADQGADVEHGREQERGARAARNMQVGLQEGRIHVLRAVAEHIERRHQQHQVDRQLPVPAHGRHQPELLALCLPLLPNLRLRHAAADIQHQQGRHRAHHEQPTPADVIHQQPVRQRGEEETARITALQQAGHHAARLRRYRLHRQRGADAPLAAHGHAKQETQHQQHGERGGKRRQKLEQREHDHVDHQDRATPETVGQPAKQQRPYRPRRQREKQAVGDMLLVDVEFLRHRDDARRSAGNNQTHRASSRESSPIRCGAGRESVPAGAQTATSWTPRQSRQRGTQGTKRTITAVATQAWDNQVLPPSRRAVTEPAVMWRWTPPPAIASPITTSTGYNVAMCRASSLPIPCMRPPPN